jgi:uncharacterized protein YjbI with pentapeptide repeats
MIKFNVTSRLSKSIAFTAEIDATDDTAMSVKLGLSVNWALENGADLSGADLSGANLSGVNLFGVHRANDFIKLIQIETYPITYTDEVLQIGCERHKITEWREFDNRRIADMDGKSALKFWAKYKDWIFQTIELCPAKPTASEATQ